MSPASHTSSYSRLLIVHVPSQGNNLKKRVL